MNLEKNYQLLDVVRDDGIRSMKAREMASGRALEVHLFMKPEDHALFEQLQGLPLSAKRALLECGSELKIPYIVTDPLPGETNARLWLTTLLKPMENAPEPKPIKASVWKTGTPLPDPLFPTGEHVAGKAEEPGEFTRMFQAPVAAKVETPAEPVPPASSEGEFTRMFRAAVPEAVGEPMPELPAEPQKAPVEEAGEFTRMFQAPVSTPAPKPSEPEMVTRTMQVPVPATDDKTRLFPVPQLTPEVAPRVTQVAPPAQPPAPAKQPGEFTRLFESMQPGAPDPAPPKPSGPGEFTRMFQSPLSPGAQNTGAKADSFPQAPPPPPPQNRGGEFTQLFGKPSSGPAAPAAPPLGGGMAQSTTGAFGIPQAPQPIRTAQPQGPGEFTRIMSAGPAPTLGQQAQQPHTSPVAKKKSNMPLIIILGSLALFAVLIVVFFAMRR